MSDAMSELEFIALAAGLHERRVQTPEGAKFYGQPIGTIITPDLIKAKKLEHALKGIKPPKGGLSPKVKTGSKKGKSANVPNVPDASHSGEGSLPAHAASQGKLPAKPSTISGPNAFKVGVADYSAPEGSKLIRPKNTPDMAYILTPDGEIHAFTADGEVDVPDYLHDVLKQKFSNLQANDPLYTVEKFDAKKSQQLADLPSGAKLTKAGEVAFQKQEDGSWLNETLGVTLSDQDLQSAFDNGAFEVQSAQATNHDFSKMTAEEISAALDTYPVGHELGLGPTASLKKQADGTWKSSVTGKNLEPDALGSLASGTNILHDTPPERHKGDQTEDPLTKASAEAPATPEIPAAEDPKQNLVTSQDVWDAKPGDVLYHDQMGALTQHDDGKWYTDGDKANYMGSIVAGSADGGYVSKLPWNEDQKKKHEDFVNTPQVTTPVEKPQKAKPDTKPLPKGSKPAPDLTPVTSLDNFKPGDEVVVNDFYLGQDPYTLVKQDNGDWAEKGKENGPTFSDADLHTDVTDGVVFMPKKTPEPAKTPDAPTAPDHNPNDFQTVDLADGVDGLNSAPVGAYIRVADANNAHFMDYMKQKDGQWHSVGAKSGHYTDFTFPSEEFQAEFDDHQVNVWNLKPKAPESTKPDVAPAALPTQDFNEVHGMKKGDVQDAINSLEGHSGFQVKYGLKTLPDNHPLKNSDTLAKVQAEASDAYPDLPPKKALIKHLKASIGAEDGAVAEAQKAADTTGNKILIGSSESKLTQTGDTGGSFTKTEIQDAINILENFDGKIFKAELNKKGNPLGKLSPNDIVGFNKDKTVTKQKFIDLLKQKLTDNPDKPKDATPDTNAPELPMNAHHNPVDTPTPGKVVAADENMTALQNAPVGTLIERPTQFSGSDSLITYQKVADNKWVKTHEPNAPGYKNDSLMFFNSAMNGKLLWAEKPILPESGGQFDSVEQLTETPVGHYVQWTNGSKTETYKKLENGKFKALGSGTEFDQQLLDQYLTTDFGTKFKISYVGDSLPESGPAIPPKTDMPQIGDNVTSTEHLKKLPNGSVLLETFGEGKTYWTKTSSGEWHNDAISSPWSSEKFGSYVTNSDKFTLHTTPTDIEAPSAHLFKVGEAVSKHDMQDMPNGTQLMWADNPWYKDSEGDWWGISSTEPVAKEQLPNGTPFTVAKIGSYKNGDSIYHWKALNDLPEGSIVQYSKDATLFYKKNADGTWSEGNDIGYASEQKNVPSDFANVFDNGGKGFYVKQVGNDPWAPASVPDSIADPELVKTPALYTKDMIDAEPIGTVFGIGSVDFPEWTVTYVKVGTDKFYVEGNHDFWVGKDLPALNDPSAYSVKKLQDANPDFGKKVSAGMLAGMKAGSVAELNDKFYTKNEGGQWTTLHGDKLHSDALTGASLIYEVDAPVHNLKQTDPPKADSVQVQLPPVQIKSEEHFASLPVNSFIQSPDSWYQKQENGVWFAFSKDGNNTWTVSGSHLWGVLSTDPNDSFDIPVFDNPYGYKPGKYGKVNGKTWLFINADGTGVYQGFKGVVTPLNAEAVKKKFDEGFNSYVTDKVDAPKVGTAEALKTKGATAKKVGDISDLPDGKYYFGNPNSAKAQVFEVTGDKVLHTKPLSELGDQKLGKVVEGDFPDLAPTGTEVESSYFGKTLVKKEDGTWVTKGYPDGSDQSSYLQGWYKSKFKVTNLGLAEPVELKKSSLKTKFLTGKLLDSTGTSVVPKNYTGNVMWFGVETNAQTLLALKNDLENKQDISPGTLMNSHGLKKIDAALFKQKLTESLTDYNNDTIRKYASEHIAALLDTVDTSVPTSDTSALFQTDELGYTVKPVDLAAFSIPDYYGTTVGEATAKVKEIANMFGDGTEIGQLPTTMDKSDKINWMTAVYQGNFSKAYTIEFNAAATSGKSLPAGYKHPGYPDNTATHQVQWGAVVKGEIPAGSKVEGDWSTLSPNDWSIDEVNNYLISAQMQNPTYLSLAERRKWVTYHKHGSEYKDVVDKLSATALKRKNDGQLPLSEEISWVDDIIPAKSYDKLFEGTDYPLTWGEYGNKTAGLDWYKDNIDDPGKAEILKQGIQAWIDDNGYTGYTPESLDSHLLSYAAPYAVQKYFEKAEYDYQQELLKPVFTKKSGQTKGSHPGAFYTDQFGKNYYAKWWYEEDQLSNYRLEIEHAGNKIGRAFGFKTADSRLIQQDGHYTQMQDVVEGVGDLTNFDFSTITPKMIADIEGEHMLDWMLQNDDTKADNAIVTADGHVVGIDKARSFKDYGAVSWDHDAPDGNLSIYTRLYSAVKSGKVSKETMDAAYAMIRKRSLQMQKSDNKKFFDLIEAGSVNRPGWTIGYKIDGKPVSQDVEGLKAAFADQKANLADKVEAEWTKLYKDAGLGDLPEIVTPKLGEGIHSGLHSPDLHEQVHTTKSSGVSAIVGGQHVIGGTVHMWTEEEKSGDVHAMGEMYLAPKAQQSALEFWTEHAGAVKHQHAPVTTDFAPYDQYWGPLLAGAKTVNQHAVDKQYNAGTIQNLNDYKSKLEAHLEEWSPNLISNKKSNGLDVYEFKDGYKVPMEHLAQYKLALDYYQPKFQKVVDAHAAEGKVEPNLDQYEIIQLHPQKEILTSPDGSQSITMMANNKILWAKASGVTHESMSETEIADLKKSGWTSSLQKPEDDTAPKAPSTPLGAVFQQNASTYERAANHDPKTNVKVLTGSPVDSGTNGSEFQATLPTGEVIYWRDSDNTNTARGQQGKLTFKVPNQKDPTELGASMQRIQEFLDAMGLDTHDADHGDAELTYWREMYGVLENRNHNSEGGKKFANVAALMNKKRKEIGGKDNQFLENLSEKMTVQEQNEWWREIWSTEFKDQVDKLIAEEAYLPKFDHQNIQDPTQNTGKPYWERFDTTFEDLFAKQGFFLAHSSGNNPGDLNEIENGGLISGEERIRQLGKIYTGGGYGSSSPLSDQNNGSSHQIYTRLVGDTDTQQLQYYNYILNPRLLLRTRTYVLTGDQYGKLDARKQDTQSDLSDLISNHINAGGETMTPNMASILDGVELMIFDQGEEKKREAQIQKLKAMGLEEIRGLPIEDRLVMRQNFKAAIQKVKEAWNK